MNLETMLGAIRDEKERKRQEQQIFDEKLKQLKDFQENTEKRKDKLMISCFTSEIYKLISSLTYVPEYHNRKDKALKLTDDDETILIYVYESNLCFSCEFLNFKLNTTRNKFSEVYDWWANETYRHSHMLPRINLLKAENKMCDIIENNIDKIYSIIFDKMQKSIAESKRNSFDILSKFNLSLNEQSSKQTIKITIETFDNKNISLNSWIF